MLLKKSEVQRDLLDILACPKCKKPIELDREKQFFICNECKVKYPITEGIPELLIEKSTKIN